MASWKRFASLGLAIAEAVVPGADLPREIIKATHAALGKKGSRNPEEGADFAAAALRESLQSYFPDRTMERIDHIVIRFAALALKQRLPAEKQKPEPKRKPTRKSRRQRRRRR